MTRLAYNVGLTVPELDLLIKLIDDEEDLTDEEEAELAGIRRKMRTKRKQLRQPRKKRWTSARDHSTMTS